MPKVSAERKYFPRLWRVLMCKSQCLGGKMEAPRKGNQLPQLPPQHPFQPLTHLPQAWLLTHSSPISACFLPWRVPFSPPDPSPPSPHSVSLEEGNEARAMISKIRSLPGEGGEWEESSRQRGAGTCTGPGAGPGLLCWRNSEEPVWSRVIQREEWRAVRDQAGGAEPCGLLGRLGLFTRGEVGPWRAKIGGGVGSDRCSRAPSGCCGED